MTKIAVKLALNLLGEEMAEDDLEEFSNIKAELDMWHTK